MVPIGIGLKLFASITAPNIPVGAYRHRVWSSNTRSPTNRAADCMSSSPPNFCCITEHKTHTDSASNFLLSFLPSTLSSLFSHTQSFLPPTTDSSSSSSSSETTLSCHQHPTDHHQRERGVLPPGMTHSRRREVLLTQRLHSWTWRSEFPPRSGYWSPAESFWLISSRVEVFLKSASCHYHDPPPEVERSRCSTSFLGKVFEHPTRHNQGHCGLRKSAKHLGCKTTEHTHTPHFLPCTLFRGGFVPALSDPLSGGGLLWQKAKSLRHRREEGHSPEVEEVGSSTRWCSRANEMCQTPVVVVGIWFSV